MRKFLFVAILAMASVVSAMATNVTVTMNAVSTTMTFVDKATNDTIEVGEPANKVYNFTAAPGTYVLTGYDTDGTTVNGTIDIVVNDVDSMAVQLFTVTTYATNSEWAYGTDYTIDHLAVTKYGVPEVTALGDSKTAGKKTFLVQSGDTYFCDLIPTAAHPEYSPLYKNGTVTFNATVSGAIPLSTVVTVTAPADADVFVGRKKAHYVPFVEIPADSTIGTVRYYTLASNTEYNYRVSKAGMLTNGGIFKTNVDAIEVTAADMQAKDPKWIDHDVTSNGGYNVADIFLNINEQEHLKLSQGDTYDLITLRNWEVINTITSNYFIEPDYHFTVTDLNGQADSSVVTIDADGTLHAVGNGTAIVTVTYDAICLRGMAGGDYWSAIWPENTGVFVVTVGEPASGIELGMTINPTNETKYKLSGQKYDADFDVFYFPDTTNGCHYYTFHPTNVASVEVAYPTIGVNEATYSGFTTDGVTYDAQTGDYTVCVKTGRQIVKLTNATGVSEYQVLVGKPVHIEVTAEGRNGLFLPGDQITIQYSGLFHPANKLAGIHNFNATTILYHEGTELKSKANQYTFCSDPTAQVVTITIPDTLDMEAAGYQFVIDAGVLKVGGFGDPIGNHRNTSKKYGRGANFTAVAQNATFGYVPGITLKLSKNIHVATFEERTLLHETAWYGDSDFEDKDNYWTSGDYTFSTYWDNWGESGIYYYDITMANLTGKTFSWTNPYYDQYSAAGGAAEGENYAIWYYNYYGNANVKLINPDTVSGMAVTNNAWVADAILKGDGMSEEEAGQGLPFHQDDWIKLTITGYDSEGDSTGTVEFYLADFRTAGDWKYAENWQWVDLTSLGEVSEIGFAFSSTKANSYGMSTPAYFCFDNLGGQAADCRLGEMTHVDEPSGLFESTTAESAAIVKRIENGRLIIILPDGKRINAIGQEVR